MANEYENIVVMGKSGAGKQPRIDVLTQRFGLKQLSTGNMFRTYLGLFNELKFDGTLDAFYDSGKENFIPDAEIQQALDLSGDDHADDVVLGMKAKYFVNQGLFVPDYITNALFEAAFRAMGYRGTVLDGFPRTLEQAKFLKNLTEEHQVRLDAILLVENDDDAIIARTVGRRICTSCDEVYHVEHRPVPESGSCENQAIDCNIVQRSDDTVDSLEARLKEFHTKAQPALDYLSEMGIPLYKVPGNLPTYTPEAVKASVFEAMGIS